MAQLALKAVSWGAEKVGTIAFVERHNTDNTLRFLMRPFTRSQEATFAHPRLTSTNEGSARRRGRRRRNGRGFEKK